MRKKLWGSALAACLMFGLTACGSNSDNSNSGSAANAGNAANNAANKGNAAANASNNASAADGSADAAKLDPVDLTWYYLGPAGQSDLGSVEDAVNKITQEKINATVKLKPIDGGEYNQRMNTIAASGEAYDISWTANWLFDYVGNANKGVFLPLDDLLDKYGAELKASLPDFMWEQVKVGGKIYGVPNYQSVTGREGFVFPQEIIDKYKLDLSTVKKFEDIAPMLDTIKKAEPKQSPIVMDRNGMFGYLINSQGIDSIPVTSQNPVGFYNTDDAVKLFNVYASPEFKHYTEVVRDWYQKGYINADAPTNKSVDDVTKAGQGYITYSNGLNPGSEVSMSNNRYNGKPVVFAPLTNFLISSNPGIATVNAISANSKNPERAMMFLNLVNTDKELYNLLSYGIEGKHYTKVGDNTIKAIPDSGYNNNNPWVFGDTFNGFLQDGQAADTFDVQKKTNDSATPTKIVGFKFDTSSLTAEIANVQSVLDEYMPGLSTGAVDPAKKLPDFLDRLQKAGIDKIVAEAQKQVDAWKTSK
ncbi:ABC transporter substrate-binding protein [Paenibacillus lycopersici]|uniref:ABC transporter substrate-binding protein n=1 Tax=Paenibacillus lycopersici TaxID=2704462 RepID=A0A6C0G5R4_9BACL|nr:ABC transporter substrate-binding protein [Paenibacillus lycopersici]QHT63059.1 ABC transporter substrate-binding protein [Paenibacillus lycopersici]